MCKKRPSSINKNRLPKKVLRSNVLPSWLEESELDRPACAIEALGECNQALRLNGLALMSIHRRIDIDTEKVIDLFAAKKARRLNLIL